MGPEDKKPGPETPQVPIAPSEPKETLLPEIAGKADDLFEIKNSVEDAASVSGRLSWHGPDAAPAFSTNGMKTNP